MHVYTHLVIFTVSYKGGVKTMRSDGQTDWRIRSLRSGVKKSRAASAVWL